MKNNSLNFLLKVISYLAGYAGTLRTLFLILFSVKAISSIYYDIAIRKFEEPVITLIIVAISIVFSILSIFPWKDGWKNRLIKFERYLRPAILLWIIPCLSFPWILISILIISWVVFRISKEFKFVLPDLPNKYGWYIVTVISVGMLWWGMFLQKHAYDTHFFIWGDWNQYVDCYHYLASGKARLVQWFSVAGHCNLFVNLVMVGALKILNAPETIFLINAICIVSILPLSYWLSYKCKLNIWYRLSLLPIIILNPVLSNQYTCLFYGFHPIVFFIPIMICFFIARECKSVWGMIATFIVSLFIQETVCVFWAGYAIYLLFCKKWKTSICLFIGMVGLFLFCSKVVIPAAHSLDNYAQMFHYSHLGDNFKDILLSPIFRPKVFWGTIFEKSSFCFGLAVFIPFFWGIIFRPLILVVILPIFLGVILQGSADVKTVMLQYGLECTVFSTIVVMLNWKTLNNNLRRQSVFAILTASFLCGLMLAVIPGGKGGEKNNLLACSSGKTLLDFLYKATKDSKRIVATSHLRVQFQFTHSTREVNLDYLPGDAIILDLKDYCEDKKTLEKLRRKIALDKRVVPITYATWDHHPIVVYKVMDEKINLPPISWCRVISKNELNKLGNLIPPKKDDYELRYIHINGKTIYRFVLLKAVNYDFEFYITQNDKQNRQTKSTILFGNGLFPAFAAKENTMFEFVIPGTPRDVNIIIHKAKSRL